MSNTSNERLIVAAVKGDCEAIEELKKRAIHAQHGIRSTLQKRQYTDAEIESLESQIVNQIIDGLHNFSFQVSFAILVFRLTINSALRHEENIKKASKNKIQNDIRQPESQSSQNLSTESAKHPPLEQIDSEIRSLVYLLNQSPYIQTTSSCSGHPSPHQDKQHWSQYGGWIDIIPVEEASRAFHFLTQLQIRLDNSGVLKSKDNSSFKTVRQRYQRVDADTLFQSRGPIILVNVSFRFFAIHPDIHHRLEIWKRLITSMMELIPADQRPSNEFDTPATAEEYLQQTLNRLPFIYSARIVRNQDQYTGIDFKTFADLALLKQLSAVDKRMQECLYDSGYMTDLDTEENKAFNAKWVFTLRPFLNQELIPFPHLLKTQWEPRTREDHLKIWKLLENTVAEQLEHEEVKTV